MSQNQDEKSPVVASSGSPKGTTIFLLLIIGFLFGFSTGIYVKDRVFQAYFKIVNNAVKSTDTDAEPVQDDSDVTDTKPLADPAAKPATAEEDKKADKAEAEKKADEVKKTDEAKKADEEKKPDGEKKPEAAAPPALFGPPAATP